jgi:hypothetical protein
MGPVHLPPPQLLGGLKSAASAALFFLLTPRAGYASGFASQAASASPWGLDSAGKPEEGGFRATGWQRLASAPLFEGAVVAGQRYFLVDDFVGQGGTLANLRGHIVHHGGHVVGAACLTGRVDSSKLALALQTLEGLRHKHGPELEAWWVETCGYDFACLTESEARYLFRVENADTVRARLAEARSERDD